MPGTCRLVQAILILLQLIPIVVLSVGSFRMKHWLAPALQEVPAERLDAEDSVPVKMRTARAARLRPGSAENRK